jgi:hypothetical protein
MTPGMSLNCEVLVVQRMQFLFPQIKMVCNWKQPILYVLILGFFQRLTPPPTEQDYIHMTSDADKQ